MHVLLSIYVVSSLDFAQDLIEAEGMWIIKT